MISSVLQSVYNSDPAQYFDDSRAKKFDWTLILHDRCEQSSGAFCIFPRSSSIRLRKLVVGWLVVYAI